MGFAEDIKARSKMWRGVKTVFFLVAMLVSFLIFSAPTLLVIADALLPFSLLSASLSPSNFSISTLPFYLSNYDFRRSLVDIPLISIFRSAVIVCVYSLCDGPSLSRGPYLGITTVCSVVSLVFVSMKAAYVFGAEQGGGGGGGYLASRPTEVALFVCSLALAVGHIVVAYRTSCKERRKLLVYKIDIEAVSAYKNVLPRYHKALLEERQNSSKKNITNPTIFSKPLSNLAKSSIKKLQVYLKDIGNLEEQNLTKY